MFTTAQMMVLDLVALIQALVSLELITDVMDVHEHQVYMKDLVISVVISMTVITGITLNIAISCND